MIVLFSVRFLDTTRHFVKDSKRKFRRLTRFSLSSMDVNLKQMVRGNAGGIPTSLNQRRDMCIPSIFHFSSYLLLN